MSEVGRILIGMTRPSSGRAATVVRVLLVFAPVLVPAGIVLLFVLAFLVLIVADAFADGFAQGCAALAALIGIPSLMLLWLSKVIDVLGIGRRRTPTPPAARGAASGARPSIRPHARRGR